MKLFKSTLVVSFFTIISRISGFVRDWLMLRFFGATIWTDAFLVAFRIPNFMRRLFAEGSFSLAFVPVLNEIKARGDRRYLKSFINHVSGALLAVLLIVLAFMEWLAPGVVTVFAPGLQQHPPLVFDVTVGMLRITLPYMLMISLVAFCGGILNSFHRFAIPAVTPVLLNVSLIITMLWWRDGFAVPEFSLAWGVFFAGVIQLLFQLPALMRLGLLPKPVVRFNDPEVRKVMKLMVPTLIGSSVAQVNLLVDTLIATLLPLVGSVTYLYAADRLVEFPLGVFGIAISTVILPKLSFAFANKSHHEYEQTMSWAMQLALLIVLPCAVGLAFLALPVILTLFTYGDFVATDAMRTSHALMVYMLGLPAFVINKVLLPAFYSRKDTKTPVKIAVKAMLLNAVLNVVFVGLLWWQGFVSLHVGLAMAGVGSAWLQSLLLYRQLKVQSVLVKPLVERRFLFSLLVALMVMVGWLFFIQGWQPNWLALLWYQRFVYLVAMVSSAAALYFIVLYLFGIRKQSLWKS